MGSDGDVSDVEIVLSKKDTSLGLEIVETEEGSEQPTENRTFSVSRPTSDQDYILNELSFEIKKMTAEIKYLNTELNDLKSLSKMWANPLTVYSKEIILKNGSTVFGKIIYQDEKFVSKCDRIIGFVPNEARYEVYKHYNT